MTIVFKNALADLRPEEVDFILSQLPPVETAEEVEAGTDSDMTAAGTETDPDAENRRRRRIERDWPDVGTILTADYCGTTYAAEVIPATKRLKSGKQIRITSGPAQGVICDSFSEAMIAATEQQRNDQSLGRKGTSNGWLFWQWDGKPPEYNDPKPDGDE